MPGSGIPRWRHAGALLVVCAAGIWAYAGSLDAPFALDDQYNITNNPRIRLESLDAGALRDAAFGNRLERPVAYLSFAANYALGGYDPFGWHLFNVGLHLLNGALVYWLAWRLLGLAHRGSRASERGEPVLWLGAALGAAVFVALPVQTQAVTYVVQRMTSLATAFTLLALLLWLEGRLRRGAARTALWAGAPLCWILGLGSKEIAATAPALALGIEFFFLRDLDRAWLRRQLPIGAALLLAGLMLMLVFVGPEPWRLLHVYESRDFSLGERLLTELRVVSFYVSLLLWPAPWRLNIAHDFPISHSLLDPPSTLVAGLFLSGLLVLALLLARRERVVSFGILWFFANLVLESTVFPLELAFEHRIYLPSVGFALIVAELASRGFARRPRLVAVLGCALLGGLVWGTQARNAIWSDEVTFWSDAAAKSPEFPRTHNNLGVAYMRAGRYEEAAREFRATLRLDPKHRLARMNLGFSLMALGRPDEAARLGMVSSQASPELLASMLHEAIDRGNLRRLARLLEFGADPNARRPGRGTLLHVAAQRGDARLVAFLLQRGADPTLERSNGATPLHEAAANGHTDVVRLLLLKGAPLEDPGPGGATALELAERGGHAATAELLRRAGAATPPR
jgi:tetratricopeptide (TPR) repeat protein